MPEHKVEGIDVEADPFCISIYHANWEGTYNISLGENSYVLLDKADLRRLRNKLNYILEQPN